MPRWVLRVGFVLAALSPLLLGTPAVLALWLLMPVAVECSREVDENYFFFGAILVLLGVTWYTQSRDMLPLAMVWGGCGMGMLIWSQQSVMKRSAAWVGICLVFLLMTCLLLNSSYQGQAAEGLAREIVEWINLREDSADILWQCYQMGLARLEDNESPLINLFGMLLMTPEVKQQLLYSLRFTLTTLIRTLIPQAVMAWMMFTAVLAAAVPDVVRRRRGLRGRLIPFGEWCMTDTMRRCLNLMVVGYLLQLFVDAPLVATLGSLCGAAFQYAYMILGLAVMEGVTKQFGTARPLRRLWMAACILLAPVVLVILGVVDGWFDLRRLRRSTDDEGGYEQ